AVLVLVLGLVIMIGSLLSAGASFCIAMFMRAAAKTVHAPGQALNCLLLAIFLGIVMLFAPGTGGVTTMGGGMSGGCSSFFSGGNLLPCCCIGGGLSLLPLGVIVWFVITLFLVQGCITRYLAGDYEPS